MIKFIFLILQVYSTVIGIDFGTDFIKASVIKAGGNIQTVLNRESKRKTVMALNIRNGIRTYGLEAQGLGMRFPESTILHPKPLLGKLFTESAEYQKTHSIPIVSSDRSTVTFQYEATKQMDVEVAAAMILKHIKKQAEDYAETIVTGAVVTVPPHYTISQRQALLDACEIADIKVYGLLNDATAIALNYAVGKKFTTKTNVMFYDVGAGTTSATIISFHSGSDPKKGIRDLVDIEVKAFNVDDRIGGQQFDDMMLQILVEKFLEAHPNSPLTSNSRAMTRLRKEANRAKAILSANKQVIASVESLIDEIDFKSLITREEYEAKCAGIIDFVGDSISNVLDQAKVKLENIDQVVIFGGQVRMPAILEKLGSVVTSNKIARNVDGDEAAVFGAVLHAAKVSASFKLGQTPRIKDRISTGVSVHYPGKSREITTLLFPDNSFMGTRKTMTFKNQQDFSMKVEQGKTELFEIEFKGITDAFAKWGEKSKNSNVKITMQLTDSGMFEIVEAKAVFEIKVEPKKDNSFADKVKSFLGGSDSDQDGTVKDESKTEEENTKTEANSEVKNATETATTNEKEPSKETESVKKGKKTKSTGNKVVTEQVALDVKITGKTIRAMSADEKKAARSILLEMDAEDAQREAREARLNNLEAYIYKCKELTWKDDINEFATETELESLSALIEASSEFFEYESDNAENKVLDQKLIDLKGEAEKIFNRYIEVDRRPVLQQEFEESIVVLENQMAEIDARFDETKLVAEKWEKAKTNVEQVKKWYEEMKNAQSALPNNVDAVLLAKDLEKNIDNIQKYIADYDPKKVIKVKPVEKTGGSTKNPSDNFEEIYELLKNAGMAEEEIEKRIKSMKEQAMKEKAKEKESTESAESSETSDGEKSDTKEEQPANNVSDDNSNESATPEADPESEEHVEL